MKVNLPKGKVIVRKHKCPSCIAGFSPEDVKANCTCSTTYSLKSTKKTK